MRWKLGSLLGRYYHVHVIMLIAVPEVGKGVIGFKAAFHAGSWWLHPVLIGEFKGFFEFINIETTKEASKEAVILLCWSHCFWVPNLVKHLLHLQVFDYVVFVFVKDSLIDHLIHQNFLPL